ncbi:MAG: glutaconyl-CoA decarboxylase subunit beta, partial [Bacteroidaceae bacterium]|nr:glutaconyl-CoA decarboxylase subunit beta [Bacteroidaceae bacterium]
MKKHIKYFLSLALAFMVASPAMAFNMEDGLTKFFNEMGFVSFVTGDGWKNLVMIAIGCFLLFLAIKKKYEPLLL